MINKRGYDPNRLREPKGHEPMWDRDPIWPGMSHLAYTADPAAASGSVAPYYPYKVAPLPRQPRPSLPQARLKKIKRSKGEG